VAMPLVLTSDQTGRNPICRPAKDVSLADAQALLDVFVRIQFDRAAGNRPDAHAVGLAAALDRDYVPRNRGALDRLRLIGDDVAHKADHRREAFRPQERTIWVKPDRLVCRFVGQFEATVSQIRRDQCSARFERLTPKPQRAVAIVSGISSTGFRSRCGAILGALPGPPLWLGLLRVNRQPAANRAGGRVNRRVASTA
jgi:hypothetical protein